MESSNLQQKPNTDIDLTAPDIYSASDRYAQRFSGAIGRWFLETQARIILEMIGQTTGPLKIMELGGGHGQLAPYLLALGHHVCVHGSNQECLEKLAPLQTRYPQQLTTVVSSAYEVPFADQSFDLVISVRMLAHLSETERFIGEATRLSKQDVILDFAPNSSLNIFYPILFHLKKLIEGDTRTFLRQSPKELGEMFAKSGFKTAKVRCQFLLPMGLHRYLGKIFRSSKISRTLENVCCRLKLTDYFGSPGIIKATSHQ